MAFDSGGAGMTEQTPISVVVKLGYWDAYRLSVVVTATMIRKILYFWGSIILVCLVLTILLLIRPIPGQESEMFLRNVRPLKWLLGLPIVFVFVVPLLTARVMMKNERYKRGITYRFSEAGFQIEAVDVKTEFAWAAVQRVRELGFAFLVFTNPSVAIGIPRKCFESARDVAALRELFRAHVAKTKLRRD